MKSVLSGSTGVLRGSDSITGLGWLSVSIELSFSFPLSSLDSESSDFGGSSGFNICIHGMTASSLILVPSASASKSPSPYLISKSSTMISFVDFVNFFKTFLRLIRGSFSAGIVIPAANEAEKGSIPPVIPMLTNP